MDIVIKSFFRPYYLERCLRSISLHVKGDYKITILDDGTPEIYLARIKEKFPNIRIVKSRAYDKKVELIANHLSSKKKYQSSSVPVESWKNFINECSNHFLLLEEDCWITNEISMDFFEKIMIEENLLIVKLGWNNNQSMVNGNKIKLNNEIDELIPKLPIHSLFIMTPYFKNFLKIKSILNKLDLVTVKSLLPYYQLYTVSSAFFNKKYWKYLWQDANSNIDEPSQLLRALMWYNKDNIGRYAKSNVEYAKTSFLTASTNRFRITNFDMIRLNHILNHSWLNMELDANQNFPDDFDLDYLQQFVTKYNDPLCTISNWNKWIEIFKGIHINAGSIIK